MSQELYEYVVDLQMQCAHQEQAMQELSVVMYSQQKMIDQLAAELKILKQQLFQAGMADHKNIENNVPPPHY
jgi:uncharacterized coiled-coil protein SlyX